MSVDMFLNAHKSLFATESPEAIVKIYDSTWYAPNRNRLHEIIRDSRWQKRCFAGVAHISDFEEYGPIADLNMWGGSNRKNPENVYPYSIVLKTGKNLPAKFGRCCLEESVLFGREAELYLKKGMSQWKKEYAVAGLPGSIFIQH